MKTWGIKMFLKHKFSSKWNPEIKLPMWQESFKAINKAFWESCHFFPYFTDEETEAWDFPGGPLANTPGPQCKRAACDPWSGN